MAAAASGQNQQNQAISGNLQMRQILLASAPRETKNLGTFTAPVGGTTRVKLFNVGIGTKLLLFVSAPITIGTAIAVPSGKAPWNLINRVRVTDYDGTDRVNLSGFQLFVWNSVRRRTYYGYNNEASAPAFTNPSVPTAIGAGTLSFFIEIPLAYDIDNPVVMAQDLRGSMMMQTAVGESYLNVDWNNSLYGNNDVESVFAGAATSTVVLTTLPNGINLTVWQDFLMPQAVGPQGAVPLPLLDLNTVYEFAGNIKSSDNLASGAERLFQYPNLRSVVGAYYNFVAGGVLATTVTGLRLIVNANNILWDNTYLSQLFRQRVYLGSGSDLQQGVFFFNHRDKPVETWLYGNVQMGFTPSAVGATPYVEQGYESFYTKGAALPGIAQG